MRHYFLLFWFVFLTVSANSLKTSDKKSCRSANKQGRCPPLLLNPSKEECVSSSDCEGTRICCYGGENVSKCSDPLETKCDQCPSKKAVELENKRNCSLDSDCPGEEKCCPRLDCTSSCATPKKSNTVINFRQSCPVIIPEGTQCPAEPTSTYPCTSNADCETQLPHRMCCSDRFGNKVCSQPNSPKKNLGSCPGLDSIQSEGAVCLVDTNCPGSQLCCLAPGNCFVCADPVPETSGGGCVSVEKKGVCPASLINEGKETCTSNAQCPGNRLCCKRSIGIGYRCSDPFTTQTGKCPSPGFVTTKTQCFLDSDCAAGEKCCPLTNCSYYCTPVSSQTDPLYCSPDQKYGVCPYYPLNPSISCESNQECPGRQRCCNKVCSDPSTSKSGNCPAPSQVPRGPSNCFTDENCSGSSRRKCCPDANCDYYCTWSV